MTASRVTYDTNVFIRHDPAYFPAGFFMSAVVIQELTAGARDSAQTRRLDQARKQYEAEDRLLVPTGEDWWMAGKVLSALHRGLRSHKSGHVTAIPRGEQQRIIRDVLIARAAKRVNATVVTENLADFEKIQNFCNVKFVSPSDFF